MFIVYFGFFKIISSIIIIIIIIFIIIIMCRHLQLTLMKL